MACTMDMIRRGWWAAEAERHTKALEASMSQVVYGDKGKERWWADKLNDFKTEAELRDLIAAHERIKAMCQDPALKMTATPSKPTCCGRPMQKSATALQPSKLYCTWCRKYQ